MDKENHLLIKKAHAKPYIDKPNMPEGSRYVFHQGMWVDADGQPLYLDQEFQNKGGTKKFDLETGEDQKGS